MYVRVTESTKEGTENMMLKALTTNDERAWKNWVNRNGGDKTLKSYGFNENEFTVPEK